MNMSLKDKVIFMSGGSRGIGLAIAMRAAKDGAKIAIAAKTTEPHPKLEGTIYTAARDIEQAGGMALPLKCDIRDEESVQDCVQKTVNEFGGIDICINNASAISLTGTLDTEMKRYDLMHNINGRGTFLVSKTCVPYLLKAENPHILNLSPPLDMNPLWFKGSVAYTMAKYNMSMCVLGMASEFEGKIAVNALWNVDGAYGFWLPVLPQRVACVGNEARLQDCKFVYTTWCNHALYETAGVRCTEDIVG